MKTTITRRLTSVKTSFGEFTAGQKVTAIIGTAALLLASFMVFQWLNKPAYSPLYSGLSGTDAAAVVEKLQAAGTQYQLTDGGKTILVPADQVDASRIAMSAAGLPTGDGGGYSLLDKQSLSTSTFQEQTSFKRAMEGELADTISAIDGVDATVVHLALPQKQVFADSTSPATASVLVDTTAGATLDPGQVQSIVHLVASSIDGLDPDNVTVADQTGTLLAGSGKDAGSTAGGASRMQAIEEYQRSLQTQIQAILDRVVGPGNSTVQVTPVLNFDKTQVQSKSYSQPEENRGLKLTQSDQAETYEGPGGAGTVGGVVGEGGQMELTGSGIAGNGNSDYRKRSNVSDNAVNTVIETSDKAPGSLEKLGVGIMLDQTAAAALDLQAVNRTVSAAIGIDRQRGDTFQIAVVPFDRTVETTAADELKAAKAEEAAAKQQNFIRNIALGVIALLALLFMWWRGRRQAKKRAKATEYVVEQIQASRPPVMPLELEPAPEIPALAPPERTEEDQLRDELVSLVESQPEDVASLLRGWLVENR